MPFESQNTTENAEGYTVSVRILCELPR